MHDVRMETRLIRLEELSEKTGLPLAWLKRETDAERIPCVRAGRAKMFNLQQVLTTLDDRAKREGVKRG